MNLNRMKLLCWVSLTAKVATAVSIKANQFPLITKRNAKYILLTCTVQISTHNTAQLNYLVCLAKWFSVCLQTVIVGSNPLAVTWTSDMMPVWSKEFLGIHATIQCRFTLKLVCDMIITYSQMDGTDNYSQHSSITWPVWLNGLVFVHELSGPGFESRHLPKCFEIGNIGTVVILIMQGIWSSHLTFCLNQISVFG